jgi:lipoprotein-anchoring transpeptidase ErfK/SrfK
MRTVVVVCAILSIGAGVFLYYFGGFDLVYAKKEPGQDNNYYLLQSSTDLHFDSELDQEDENGDDQKHKSNGKSIAKQLPMISKIAPDSDVDSWTGEPPIKEGKAIQIILSTQRLLAWQDGVLLGNYLASTGKAKTPTKQGEFEVLTKLDMAYGSGDGDSWAMPWWLGIYVAGGTENGIHGLPYINGYKESAASLGTPMSHGCIRIAGENQEWLYNWAELGTPVYIQWTAEGQY